MRSRNWGCWIAATLRLAPAVVMLLSASAAWAQAPAANPTVEIYGFGQADAIVDFKQTNPDWYDVARPSRLPSFENQYGEDGRFYLSPRQSRFGARAASGDVKATFEFDMFGVGADAGQTTIRLRHAWGQYKKLGAGITNTQFMDADVFPNVLDYWGPNGMIFVRLTQVFWEPMTKPDGSNVRVAIEAPGASGDAGVFADRVELQNVSGRYPSPDFTGHYRLAQKWGHVQLGGVLRYIAYDDKLPNDRFDLSGHVWGWGISASSNVKVTPSDTLRLQFVGGQGVENYFNDAPIDVGVARNPGNVVTPIVGQALQDIGLVLYLDHNWNSKWSTAAGYSRVDIDNSDLQAPSAYKSGQYASFNLLTTPAPNVMMGGEFQWTNRKNFSDGWSVNDYRMQFSFKYSFSAKVGG